MSTTSDTAVVSDVPPGHPSTRHKLGGPFAYFKKCLKLYADGHGRAGVAEYWSFFLVQFLLLLPFIVLMLSDPGWSQTGEPGALFAIGFVGMLLVVLGLAIPGICVAIRRLHDIGLSGWLYLVSFVPYVGGLFMLVCSLIPSSEKDNRHGPSPKADPSAAFA